MATYVIGEIGSCHDGSLDKALWLIDAAADAGADAAKAQFWSDPDRLADRRGVPNQYREIYRRYAVPRRWLDDLKARCVERRIDFMCTAYLPEDVAIVAGYVRHFKVSSFEAEALDLLEAHRPFLYGSDRLVMISLGMGARRDDCLHRGGYGDSVRYLLCTSAYPAPVDAMRLWRLWPTSWSQPRSPEGISDHTDPALTWTGALAVAAGARYVEAHLRLADTDDMNPDAPHAMTPTQFRDYVRHVRFAESCLKGKSGVQECEEPMARYRVRGK